MSKPSVRQDPNLLGRSLICRATTYRLLGNYKASLKDANDAISLSINSNLHDMLIAEANREIGLSYFLLGNLTEGEKFLNLSRKFYFDKGDDKNLALVLLDLGVV